MKLLWRSRRFNLPILSPLSVMDPEISSAFSVGALLTAFVAFVLLFHLLFVRLCPLTSVGWKKVDYYWVGLSILGVIAAVGGLRQEVASNMADAYAQSARSDTVLVANALQHGTRCRGFFRSPASPPEPEFSRLVKEESDICEWFASAKPRFEALIREGKQVTMASLGGPAPGDPQDSRVESLQIFLAMLRESRTNEETLRREVQAVKKWEGILRLIGPWILAAAIALRMTKVTGEIKLEKAKRASATGVSPAP